MIDNFAESDLECSPGAEDQEGEKIGKRERAGKLARKTGRKLKDQLSSTTKMPLEVGRKLKDKYPLSARRASMERTSTGSSMRMPLSARRATTESTSTGSSPMDYSSILRPKLKAITSIAVLSDGYILTASRSERMIKMFQIVPSNADSKVEWVKEFRGHRSGVTALVVLDKKGRFLSAGTVSRELKVFTSCL